MSWDIQQQERAAARSQIYGLLACALRYPDEQLFADLREGKWQEVAAQAALHSGAESEDLFRELQLLTGSLAESLGELEASYTTLFSAGLVCPHHESDYVARHAFQNAEVMADVAGCYGAFGLRVSGAYRELPDFLGTELEFLHVAAWQEANALREGNLEAAHRCFEAQETFLIEHVGAWISGFRKQVEQSGACRFYAALARLVETFILAQCRSGEKSPAITGLGPHSGGPVMMHGNDCDLGQVLPQMQEQPARFEPMDVNGGQAVIEPADLDSCDEGNLWEWLLAMGVLE